MARYTPDRGTPTVATQGSQHDAAYYTRLLWRLRTGLLAASLIPLVLLSVYFHYQYEDTHTESVHTHLRSVAENQRNIVDLYLRERLANLRSIFRKISSALPERIPKLDRWLADLRRESDAFVDLGLFDDQGRLVGYAGPFSHLVGTNYSAEPWWCSLEKSRAGAHISDVYLGFRQRPHFVMALSRAVGGRRWVLRASVDPKRFNRYIRRPYLAPESESFLVNRAGVRQTFTGSGSPPQAARPPPRVAGAPVVRSVKVNGTEYIVAYAWLAEHDWAMAVRVPQARAYRELMITRWTLVGFTVVVLVLVIFLVFYYTNRLIRRLTRADEAQETLRQELFHAAKLASVGEMAAGVAHEINNPLAIIYEETAMMRDLLDPEFGTGFDEPEFQDRLQAIQEATLRGRTITAKLLSFSRQYEPDPEPTDFNGVVERAIASRERAFELNEIDIERQLTPDLSPVLIKGGQMEQVVLNLLNNARDAIGTGGRITVSTAAENGHVICKIRDTGVGIGEAQMPQIFFPFYTTKGVGKGTGLGLSISYGIIRSFDGRIEVESEPGKGTVFTIYLPMVQGEAADDFSERHESHPSGKTPK